MKKTIKTLAILTFLALSTNVNARSALDSYYGEGWNLNHECCFDPGLDFYFERSW